MSVEERAQARTEEACLPPHLRKKRLRRDEAVEYLERVHGVVIAAATLAKMVTKGGGPRFVKGAGCVKCRGTGYLGRTAIFEIFSATPEVRHAISSKAPTDELAAKARLQGLRSLREAAVRKLAEGVTTFEEVLRMTTTGA